MSSVKLLLLIGIAGFAGTVLRYGCIRAVDSCFPGFPWGTLTVNVIGAFMAGFCFVLCRMKFQLYEACFPVLFVGFLGGFTTFSTFVLESARFLADSQYARFWGNVCLQNALGLLAAGGGMGLSRILFR